MLSTIGNGWWLLFMVIRVIHCIKLSKMTQPTDKFNLHKSADRIKDLLMVFMYSWWHFYSPLKECGNTIQQTLLHRCSYKKCWIIYDCWGKQKISDRSASFLSLGVVFSKVFCLLLRKVKGYSSHVRSQFKSCHLKRHFPSVEWSLP